MACLHLLINFNELNFICVVMMEVRIAIKYDFTLIKNSKINYIHLSIKSTNNCNSFLFSPVQTYNMKNGYNYGSRMLNERKGRKKNKKKEKILKKVWKSKVKRKRIGKTSWKSERKAKGNEKNYKVKVKE